MTLDEIIDNVSKVLEDFEYNAINEETKVAALNLVNNILYPLKQSEVINDYQFTSSVQDDTIHLGILLKETSDAEFLQWDLSLIKEG
jgi:hypothetical protein